MPKETTETTVETITYRKWELTEDEIEAMLIEKLCPGDGGSVKFYWDAREGYLKGVEITHTVSKKVVE